MHSEQKGFGRSAALLIVVLTAVGGVISQVSEPSLLLSSLRGWLAVAIVTVGGFFARPAIRAILISLRTLNRPWHLCSAACIAPLGGLLLLSLFVQLLLNATAQSSYISPPLTYCTVFFLDYAVGLAWMVVLDLPANEPSRRPSCSSTPSWRSKASASSSLNNRGTSLSTTVQRSIVQRHEDSMGRTKERCYLKKSL